MQDSAELSEKIGSIGDVPDTINTMLDSLFEGEDPEAKDADRETDDSESEITESGYNLTDEKGSNLDTNKDTNAEDSEGDETEGQGYSSKVDDENEAIDDDDDDENYIIYEDTSDNKVKEEGSKNKEDNEVGVACVEDEGIEKMIEKHTFVPIEAIMCFKGDVCKYFEPLFFQSSKSNLTFKGEEAPRKENSKKENGTENNGGFSSFGETRTQISVESRRGISAEKKTQSSQDTHKTSKTELDVKEIEELLNRKKIEYAHRIQEIEIQLLKLENRLLAETSNKQNNTASYTRLENLILKLENELLKINRSFVMIQEENNQVKAKQLSEEQIYDIFNKAKEKTKDAEQKYLALADSSTALESMVDKQQNKIIELVLMMHNQTDFINKLEEKSKRLEDQNRQLHEVLVNQSNMMSELVTGMKYMKEEQERMKTTVAHPLPITTRDILSSGNILDKDVSANTIPPNVRYNVELNEKSDSDRNERVDKIADDMTVKNIDKIATGITDDGFDENVNKIANGEAVKNTGENDATLGLMKSEEKDLTPDQKLQLLREKRKKESKTQRNIQKSENSQKPKSVPTQKGRIKNEAKQISDNVEKLDKINTKPKETKGENTDETKKIKEGTVKPNYQDSNKNAAKDSTNYIPVKDSKPVKEKTHNQTKTLPPTKNSQAPPAKEPNTKSTVVIPETPRYFNPKASGPKGKVLKKSASNNL